MPTNNAINYLPGFVQLNQQIASASAALNFTTGITSAYNDYFLVISDLLASTAANLQVQISTNGGSSYITTGYVSGNNSASYSTVTFANLTSTTGIFLSSASAASATYNYGVYLYNFTSGAGGSSSSSTGNRVNLTLTGLSYDLGTGVYGTAATTVNAIRIIPSAGTLTSGSATLYGILE
jgi:hypothetical protein